MAKSGSKAKVRLSLHLNAVVISVNVHCLNHDFISATPSNELQCAVG